MKLLDDHGKTRQHVESHRLHQVPSRDQVVAMWGWLDSWKKGVYYIPINTFDLG
jgi:hypothetical protein